jgi:hypothetical protein
MRQRMDRLFGESSAGRHSGTAGCGRRRSISRRPTTPGWSRPTYPRVKKDDVTVEVRDHELAIHGEVKERERTGMLRRHTRGTGQFDYRLTLPATSMPTRSTRASTTGC